MPQKINPIDFENSEGNLGLANALFEHFCRKLPISRLQRDLSDSTTIRNIGTVMGFCFIGYTSLLTGLGRIRPNTKQIHNDLFKDWSILSEALQTVMRDKKINDPYSLIAKLTRGEHINLKEWDTFINNLPLQEELKNAFKKLSPDTYIGLAEKLTHKAIKEIREDLKK